MPIHRKVFINNIKFEPCWVASGTLNFYGQGWPYHKLLIGLDFGGLTFVSKTTTLEERLGNMPLKENLMPKEWIPQSIHINRKHKCALNAVSLSGPGAKVILSSEKLHNKTEPFQISFMSVQEEEEDRIWEFQKFIKILLSEKSRFKAPIGLQLNITCPNTGHENPKLKETLRILDLCDPLIAVGMAIILKVSVEMSTDTILEFGRHKNCHAITTSNTVPFGKMPEKIDWKKIYPNGSPLSKRKLHVPGAGGLSGTPLLNLVIEQVKELKLKGFTKHINAGGGILCKEDVRKLKKAGADSISIGSVAFLKPLNIPGIRIEAWDQFGEENFYK
ncbi:MAG: hypothetical protein NTW62_03785 [Candidatus Nomurabacteria bacterium]|nr:hypothetical protein [Candidatus Nomurabacteria bacterium]